MKNSLLLCLLLISFYAQAQRFQGKILDQQNAPLEYVNVGVIGKDVGTVTSVKGTFALTLDDSLNSETILFSAIGYKPVKWKVSEFKQKFASQTASIQLQEDVVSLNEVVVRPKEYKTKVVGNTTDSKTMMAGFKINGLGSEVGSVLKIKKPSFVEKITVNVARNQFDTLFLRINIYKMGKNGPEENLLREPIFINLAKPEVGNAISVDLSKHNIYLESDSFLALELVKDLGAGGLWFSAGMFNSDTYFRKASQGTWEGIPFIGLGFNATVSQEK
ncbi:hypothetical protein TH61_02145 [Rufibacter sp. DG15C]|uniref:carboxypeptidase-like regulatory domain-containing protein n=1 Tax=Rufibacter sp. DG15C TaxID=1379909 RepID=UPI00078EE3EF|nr:carboxypeptidase-like regulatory domain-containing protein [Rufibacter sp. DG15C]AMM50212.1 hypothetical protein TH61_02145 [Rufibacter sp. DG15C]